jgi:hypothetical protein
MSRTLNLVLDDSKFKSQFYTSEEDKLLKRLKAEQDLQTLRKNKIQIFNLNRKKTKEEKKEEQKRIRELKKEENRKIREEEKERKRKVKELIKEQKNNLKRIEKERKKQVKQIIKEEKIKLKLKEKEVQKELKLKEKEIKKEKRIEYKRIQKEKRKKEKEELKIKKQMENSDRIKIKKIIEMRDNIKNTRDIKDFYNFDISLFPLNEAEYYQDVLSLFYQIYKKYRNLDIIFLYVSNKETIFSQLIYLSEQPLNSWWKTFSKFGANIYDMLSEFVQNYREFYNFNLNKNEYEGNIIIYPVQESKKEEKILLKQFFKEHSISNCLLEPIKEWALNNTLNATSKTSYYRYLQIQNKVNNYIDIYLNSGVPEDEISNICNDLQIDIDITLPLEENIKIIECKSTKKPLKKFTFINTKFNHIEHDNLLLQNNFISTYKDKDGKKIILNDIEMFRLKKKLDNTDEFYIYKRTSDKITSLITFEGNYKAINEYNEYVKNFEIETGLNYCKICDIENYELSKFVRDACHYNISLNFIDKLEENNKIMHIDMEKAYAAFNKCNYYDGFMGKITDFRKTNKIMGIGLYQINNLDFSNVEEKIKNILLKMNIYHNKFIYASPELKFLKDNNIKFDIIAGAWGHSPLYFNFNDNMLNLKDENVPYYAKWCGSINSYNTTDNYYLKSSEEYSSILSYYAMSNTRKHIKYIPDTREALVSIKKKNNFHLSHITSFILSYQRLNLIEQLREIDYNNIIKINVDCIYYYDSKKEIGLKNVFRHKEYKNLNLNDSYNSFISTVEYKKNIRDYNYSNIEVDNNYKTKINLGCGGSGKTTKELRDTGLINKIFCPPSWKLARNKEKEENVNVSVWYYITTNNPEILNKILRKYNVLIIDEVSMMTEETKKYIMETFKLCKIIFCGDLGYQLPPFETAETKAKGIKIKEMTTDNIDVIEYFNNNYRCKCPNLLTLLNKCRKMITDKKSLDYINHWIINFFDINKRIIKKKNLIKYYDINDMILASTNEIKDKYTELFKGKFSSKKYYITSNNRHYSNGEIIISDNKINGVSSDERYCYTTHSIQGETAYNKIFIDINKMFDERMFYTALSRAMYLDQIYLLSN